MIGCGPILPEPAHGVGKDLGGVLAVVSAVAPGMVDFVAGKDQRAFHFLVGHPPVAAIDVLVVAAILQEDAERLGLILADQRRVDVAAAQADVGADGAEDAAKSIGPFPRRGEGADRPAAAAADGSGRCHLATDGSPGRRWLFSFQHPAAVHRAETGRSRRPGRRIRSCD